MSGRGWEDDLCGRCLSIVDTRTSIRAWRKDQVPVDYPGSPTRPAAVRHWVEEQMWGDGAMISVDDRPDAFRAVTTWHGDPVCGWHLQEEIRREYQRSP